MKQMTEDSLLCPHLLEPREAVWFAVGGVPSVGDVLSIGEAAGVMVGGGIVGVQGAVPRAQGPPCSGTMVYWQEDTAGATTRKPRSDVCSENKRRPALNRAARAPGGGESPSVI